MAQSRAPKRKQTREPKGRGTHIADVPTKNEDRAATSTSDGRPLDTLLAFAVAVVAGSVFWATAARDIVVGDTGDFLTTGATLGVAHPPGYPLLVLLAHGFSWLPVGPPAFRMNLLAVISGAITVGLVF